MQDKAQQRNKRTAIFAAFFGVFMGGMAFAAVPLYDLFCRVTGYGGTTQTAIAAPAQIGTRIVTIRFDASLARGMAWEFDAPRPLDIVVGESGLAFYKARNTTARPVTGTASFNVSPAKAGVYFSKIDCFCFTAQTLAAGEAAEMPVTFFIDPEIADDPEMDDVETITLSYTFFETPPT